MTSKDSVIKTVALRFAENFSPDCGTISAHQEVLSEKGFVWYGKLGNPVSADIAKVILSASDPKILLIHSGGQERYWAHVCDIRREIPDTNAVPEYYRHIAEKFKCWFKVIRFEKAANDVMSKCLVVSSGKRLTDASRHSMSPYFIVEVESNGGNNND